MNQEILRRYAHLIVRTGANVQAGQKVEITIQVDQAALAEELTRECYEAGARLVELKWQCDATERLDYQYASVETLGTVLPWEDERGKQQVKDLPVRIFIMSEDPDALNGIDASVLSQVSQMRQKVLKKYRDALDGKHQWCIAAAASPKWAQKVFPKENAETATEKLWDAILSCVYLDTGRDPVEVWAEHNQTMTQKAQWLNEQKFVRLEYHSSNGTDFTVGLIPEAKWSGAGDVNHNNGAYYVPNMPTEEVFTSPMKGVCEGTLVATKPLSWSGQLIEDFSVTYQNGRVVSCQAKKGEEILTKMFAMDEGAAMLGEVALVPKESPVNRSGLLFYNTLFDENACCHVAAGHGFSEVLEGFIDMTAEEIQAKGVNDSLIHVDFMVGSDDLSITGYQADGTAVPVFRNGTWAE
jgi:aminopeptidase